MTTEQIARICHETNRAYCQTIGDYSQPPWQRAALWQQASAIAGVEAHGTSLSPRESHESWLSFKQKDGWKYGPVKNADKKEHPCFLPYDQLPFHERIKDYLFKAIVTTLRPRAA